MEFLEDTAKRTNGNSIQILITTHSPNLASNVDLKSVVIMCNGQAYPLLPAQTNLVLSDYGFLRRFLDVTKANLFFAKAVVIVEGDAENILLPTLARLMNCTFSARGVSIVNVGSRGLFRYARIFQRKDGREMPVRVACIADRDIVPDAANYIDRKKESQYSEDEIKEVVRELTESDVPPVRTFPSDKWTLEYDLAYYGLALSTHIAIQLAKKIKTKQKAGKLDWLSDEEKKSAIIDSATTFREWKKLGLTREDIAAKIYEPLAKKQASKTEAAQFLAERLESSDGYLNATIRSRLPHYLVEAIEYVINAA
jgi:putative ATP-dependent endonuclease of OLD family